MESPLAEPNAPVRAHARTSPRITEEEVSLERVLVTHLLATRAVQQPDYEAEARALHRIARAMGASPTAALDALVAEGLELCSPTGNATIGVSLLEQDGGETIFRWTAMAGRLAAAIGGSTPRGFSPCGVCLDQKKPVLFRRPDTYFTYFLETGVPFIEGLILPFHVDGVAAGTLWIVSHDEHAGFDGEDVRIMSSLAEFAGIAYSAIRARSVADTASKVKSDFLALMSHELRTPLNAIGGYADLIELGIRGPVTPEQAIDLRRIRESQRHLLGLINQVLEHAQLERGTATYDIRDIDVQEAIRSALALTEPQARAKRLTCAFIPAPESAVVRADVDKLRQVLLNLLTNAMKFTESGGRISIGWSAGDGSARIWVTDSGCGIAPEIQSRIFDPFVQASTRLHSPHEGVGLGLAISRELARGMGGDIEVESTVGSGATFTLELPTAAAPAPST